MANQLMSYHSADDIQKLFYTTPEDRYLEIFGGANELPHFTGVYNQKGQGIIGDLFRQYAIPFIRKAAPHVLRGVAGVLKDVSRGRDVKESVKRRGKRAAADIVGGEEPPMKYPLLS